MTNARLMMRMLCVTLLCLIGMPAWAQSTTQGAIGGTVFDPTEAIVPNAAVTIHNNGTNAEIHLAADQSGFFKAPLVEPGTYTVTIAANGFKDYRAVNVIVQVGQMTTLSPHLATGSATQVVEVTAEAPILNTDSPDFSSNLNLTALSNIPINNRRWSSLAMSTPGVVSDANGYGLVSIRGISPLLNNVLIDGADDNQAFFSEERGRTREAYSTAGSAVREFAVNTGVYSAQYGRAAGGVINSVTKSGTNGYHGDAYFYDRQSSWNAYNNYATITTPNFTSGNPLPSSYTTSHLKPKDLRKIYGLSVGGPIFKDKLFFFYTYDQHSHIFPGTAIPTNAKTFFTMPDSNLSTIAGTPTCNLATGYLSGSSATNPNYTLDAETCTLAARQGMTYNAAATAYVNGVLGLNSDLGNVPRTGYQEINTPKLDWQVNQRNHVSVLYHRLRWDSPGGVQTSPTNTYSVDAWGNDFVKLDYGVSKLSSIITSHMSNELLYQYSRELDYETQQPYSAYTKANLIGAGGNVPYINVNTSVAFNLGSPYYSYRAAYPDERKWQIGDTLYDNIGNHTLKFGVDVVHNYDLMNNTYESNGDFSYSYTSNYLNDLMNKLNGHANTCNSSALDAATATTSAVGAFPCYANFFQGFGSPLFAISTMDYGFFVQDNWKLTPRLSVELGARYDYQSIPAPLSNLTTATGNFVPYTQITQHPSDKNNIGPRIGFAWDAFGTGKTIVRAGYGMYYGRVTNGNIENILLNTGSPNGQYTTTFKANTAGAPQFANIFTGTGAASSTPNSYFFASNLQNPQIHEFDLQVQQEIGRGTVFALSYLGALGRELPNFLNLNLNPTTTNTNITIADPTGKGPLPVGSVYSVPTYTSYGNTNLFGTAASHFQSITEFTSNINSSYNGFVAEIQNHSLKLVQFDANYTWAHALDYAQNANTQGTTLNWYDPYSNPKVNYGNSNYNVGNRFSAWALVNIPNYKTNRYVDYVTNNWSVSTSFQMQNGLPYSMTVSGFAGNAVLSYWNGASGATFIPMIGRNTFTYPRRIVDDLRVQKQIPIHEAINLQLIANVFNLANHPNVDSISSLGYKLTSASGAGTATYQGTQAGSTAFGTVTNANNSGFLYTPRQIEIAARLTF
jgi:Carboxypeptidase regulatory-like domain/TonB-dependent Receptor Plug Domain